VLVAGGVGVGLIYFARWISTLSFQIYPVDDFWHTSPSFFAIRVGFLLAILAAAYVWCRWGGGAWGFSPLGQLGQTSLLVYWIHLGLVYGRFSILTKKAQDVASASLGLLEICVMMVLVSLIRTRAKGRGAEIRAWLRRPLRAS